MYNIIITINNKHTIFFLVYYMYNFLWTKKAMPISSDVNGEGESFKYLGFLVKRDGGFGMD